LNKSSAVQTGMAVKLPLIIHIHVAYLLLMEVTFLSDESSCSVFVAGGSFFQVMEVLVSFHY